MRTKRLKITEENYANLKSVQDQLPKHSKGNDTVREALNISGGAWSYLRQSNNYDEFKQLSSKGRLIDIPKDSVPFPVFPPEPPVEQLVTPSDMVLADKLDQINETLKKMDITLTRLCMAWENTPQKKGWLK